MQDIPSNQTLSWTTRTYLRDRINQTMLHLGLNDYRTLANNSYPFVLGRNYFTLKFVMSPAIYRCIKWCNGKIGLTVGPVNGSHESAICWCDSSNVWIAFSACNRVFRLVFPFVCSAMLICSMISSLEAHNHTYMLLIIMHWIEMCTQRHLRWAKNVHIYRTPQT